MSKREYEVSLHVSWSPTVIVEAESAEEAERIDPEELFQKAIEQGDLPYGSDIDVEWAQEWEESE